MEVFRAPLRARTVETDAGASAEHAVRSGLVGIGDALAVPPRSLDEAVDAAIIEHGAKAGRMLERFAALPPGTFVWTRLDGERYVVGRVAGPWRYDDSAAARSVGIHHVRSAIWARPPVGPDEAPVAVLETFARGGRNLQRIHGERVERDTAALWARVRTPGRLPR